MDIEETAETTAERSGLRYRTDDSPGLKREPWGRGFAYFDVRRNLIRGERREWIESLAIPPAWTDVWIAPYPDCHLLATGRDDRERKQYLYHPRFREARETVKFRRLLPFGLALPGLRRTVGRDLGREGLPWRKVAAAGVRILDRVSIRVGNESYQRENDSFGLTTLRSRHLSLNGGSATLRFRAKGGKETEVELTDPDLVQVLRECDETPGYRIFKYLNEGGKKFTLESEDVNEYLREATGAPFTAKDFRTWAGTVRAVAALDATSEASDEKERRAVLKDAIEDVSRHLNNTTTVSRESYIHPGVLTLYEEGKFHSALAAARGRCATLRTPGRRREECVLLALLGTD